MTKTLWSKSCNAFWRGGGGGVRNTHLWTSVLECEVMFEAEHLPALRTVSKTFRGKMSGVTSRGHSLEESLSQIWRLKMNRVAKVTNLQHTVLRHQDVFQLHVEMEDAILDKKLFCLCQLMAPVQQYFKLCDKQFFRQNRQKVQKRSRWWSRGQVCKPNEGQWFFALQDSVFAAAFL